MSISVTEIAVIQTGAILLAVEIYVRWSRRKRRRGAGKPGGGQ